MADLVVVMEKEIFERFPLLNFWKDKTHWSGFIKVRTVLLRVSISVPKYPSLEDATISGDDDCQRLVTMGISSCDKLEDLIARKGTLLELLGLLESIVEESFKAGLALELWNPDVCLNVYNELQQIGLENISYLSENLYEIHVNQQDLSFRSHKIKFFVPPGYPAEDLRIEVDLPLGCEPIRWPNRIAAACTYFTRMLEKYDSFWTDMDEIDANVQVLDPFHPTRADTHRRIIIASKVILHVDVNPVTPRSLPHVRFLGSDEAAYAFDKEFTKNCKKWNANFSVLDNMQALIDVPLPVKGEQLLTEDDVKCVICYTYNLEGDFPETVCHCGSFFHDKCLRELHLNEMEVNKSNAVDCPVCTLEIKFRS